MIQSIKADRILHRKKIMTISETFQQDIQLFLIPQLKPAFRLTSEENHMEDLYFSFMVRFAIPELDDFEQKEKIVTHFQQENQPMGTLLNRFLTAFASHFHFDFSHESYVETYYLLLIQAIYIKHLNYDVFEFYYNYTLLQQYDTENTHFSAIKKDIQAFFEHECQILSIDSTHFSKSSIENILATLYFCYSSNQSQSPIYLYLSYSKNLYTVPTIKRLLKTIFSSQILQFTKDMTQADIIISDTYEGDLGSIQHFYFDSEFSNDTWYNLIDFITRYINEHHVFYN